MPLILRHDDFLKAHPLLEPYGEGVVFGLECYELGDGPVLNGPYPVIIRKDRDRFDDEQLYIDAGGCLYWDDYGEKNQWGQSGYYLYFVPTGTPVVFKDG